MTPFDKAVRELHDEEGCECAPDGGQYERCQVRWRIERAVRRGAALYRERGRQGGGL